MLFSPVGESALLMAAVAILALPLKFVVPYSAEAAASVDSWEVC